MTIAPRRKSRGRARSQHRAPRDAPEVPATSEEALRLAVKLAVDAGEYERAAGVLDVLGRTARSAGLGR